MEIECLRYKAVNIGSLIGVADFYIPDFNLEIYGITLHQKSGKRCISMPTKEYHTQDGKKHRYSVLKLTDSHFAAQFQKNAKLAIEEWCKKDFEKLRDIL